MAIFIQWLVFLLPAVDTTSEQSFWLCPIVDCSIEKQISDTMKKAFWDSLQEKLSSQPADYSHALVLIEEVREVRIITVINFNSVMKIICLLWADEPTALSINHLLSEYCPLMDNIFTWIELFFAGLTTIHSNFGL